MNRNEIITELYNSKEFNDTIRKMNPQHLQDDLKSEVMLILCEKDEEEIKTIYESGGLKYYTARIILNLIQSNTSPFYKKFRNTFIDISLFGDGEHKYQFKHSEVDYMGIDNIQCTKAYNRDVSSIIADNDGVEQMLKECSALNEIENLSWYDQGVIKLYLKLGTYRAVEEEVGIPWESVYKTIRKACAKIKLKVA